jgi:hypothetical protein
VRRSSMVTGSRAPLSSKTGGRLGLVSLLAVPLTGIQSFARTYTEHGITKDTSMELASTPTATRTGRSPPPAIVVNSCSIGHWQLSFIVSSQSCPLTSRPMPFHNFDTWNWGVDLVFDMTRLLKYFGQHILSLSPSTIVYCTCGPVHVQVVSSCPTFISP